MLFGLNSTQFDLFNKLAIAPLHQYQCELYIWGPRAKSNVGKSADIDLLIEGIEVIPNLAEITEVIASSDLELDVNFYYASEFSEQFLQNIAMEKIHIGR